MSKNMYLQGNYGPVEDETTAFDLPVVGEIPAELTGRLLRIGPNPVEPPGESYHWFAGNGLVHGLRLRDGRAEWYRSRYVRDDQVCRVKGWDPTPGPRFSEFGGGGANTNVIVQGGKTFAIVEAGGNPVELSDRLDTVARSDFDGTLPGPFSAHPKRDPDTGELHVLGYFPGWEHLQYIVVGRDGRVRKTVDIPVPGGGRPMIHDCSITENYFIVFDFPVLFDMEMAEGSGFPFRWSEDYGARVGLLPREGTADEISWHEVDPCFVFHPLNSYEDSDGRVVLDVVRHPKMFATVLTGPNDGTPTLDRWLIDPKGGPVKEDRLSDRGQEFPRHDERLIGKPYRYGYCGAVGEGLLFGGLLKHDLETGESLHRSEPGRQYQEPVFVPRSDHADEDDGWLLSYVHNAERNAADVVILHAQDFLGAPLATIELPARVPFGFHGNWAPDA